MKTETSKKSEEKVTLESFLENNKTLITSFSIFIALTIFANNLSIEKAGVILSFIFMSLAVLVWLELWSKFPEKTGTWNLIIFENILSLSMLAIVGYWLIDYRAIWNELLFLPIFIILTSLFSFIFKKYNLFNRLFKVDTRPKILKIFRYVLGIVILISVLLTSNFLSQKLAPPLNNLFNKMNSELNN